jgi:hypothetical protein
MSTASDYEEKSCCLVATLCSPPVALLRSHLRRASRFAEAATATTSAAVGPFTLEPLPYPTDALEPFIDARTMELHHDRHHAAYVSNLNTIAKDYPQIVDMPPVDLMEKLAELPDVILVPHAQAAQRRPASSLHPANATFPEHSPASAPAPISPAAPSN